MLSTKESHDAVLQDLSDRKQWEERQRIFYQMRHTGIPRRSKPFPGAADLHFPLADSVIGKFVPFYFAQVYASDLLASFVAKDQAGAELARAAELLFDWQMNQRSNWFEEILATIDAMLVSGGGPLKVTWNAKRDRLHFDAVEPVFCVVPTTTMDLESAGRWTHILQLTEEQYKAQAAYNQDPEYIKRIKGAPQDERTQEKYRREGLTHTKSPERASKSQRWAKRWGYCRPSAPVGPDCVCNTTRLLGCPLRRRRDTAVPACMDHKPGRGCSKAGWCTWPESSMWAPASRQRCTAALAPWGRWDRSSALRATKGW